MLNKISSEKYFFSLFWLLGFSFPISMAAMNVFFYLIALSGFAYSLFSERQQTKQKIKELFYNKLFLITLTWTLLTLFSLSYSSGENALTYFRKYLKYLPVGLLSLIIILFIQQQKDMRDNFWQGFVVSLIFTFALGVFNKLTGLLTDLSQIGYLKAQYLPNGYVRSIGYFAHSLFYSVLFTYGAIETIRNNNKFGIVLCAVGLFEVFIVSQQRTGYIILLIVAAWLAMALIRSYKTKISILILLAALVTTTMMTENKVSKRMAYAFSEFSTCFNTIYEQIDDVQLLGKDCHSSNGLRMLFASDSIRQIKQSPIYGHGVGTLNITSIRLSADGYQLSKSRNPHNEYLMQGIQLGFIGIGLLAAILYLAFYYAYRLKENLSEFYAGVIIMYCTACCFNSFLLDAMEGTFFAVVLSFIISGTATSKGAPDSAKIINE